MDDAIWAAGCMTFLLFFVTDFYMAYLLQNLKRNHPTIEEVSPPPFDEVVSTLRSEGVEGDEEMDAANEPAGLHTGSTLRRGWQFRTGNRTVDAFLKRLEMKSEKDKNFVVQLFVMLVSCFAPLLCFLQMVVPKSVGWTMFGVPDWLSYITVFPALGVAGFYLMRTYRIGNVLEVSRGQWISLMWFRLDIICVVATLMLLGWGDWLVSLCLYVIDVYLAQRLLFTERRLVSTAGGSQLLPDDVPRHPTEANQKINLPASRSSASVRIPSPSSAHRDDDRVEY